MAAIFRFPFSVPPIQSEPANMEQILTCPAWVTFGTSYLAVLLRSHHISPQLNIRARTLLMSRSAWALAMAQPASSRFCSIWPLEFLKGCPLLGAPFEKFLLLHTARIVKKRILYVFIVLF